MGLPPRLVAGLVLVSLGLLAVPVALVPVPPTLDFPNHLARLCLIAGAAAEAPLDGFYVVDWSSTTTNIGMDLVAAAVGASMDCEALSRILLAAAIILPPLGAVALHAALFRGWHWWQLSFVLLAWSSTAVAGFVNFQLGMGLALLAAAADRAIAPRRAVPRFLWRAALGAPVLVCHVYGALFLGVLLAALDFGGEPVAWRERAVLARRLGRGAIAGIAGFGVPLLGFLLLAPVRPGATGMPLASYGLAEKLLVLLAPILTYDARTDFLFLAGLLLVAWLAMRLGRMRAHAGLALAAAACTALALVMPREMFDGSFVDWRFAIMAALALAVSVRPELDPRPAALAVASVLAALAMGRTAWIGMVWSARSADVAAVERAIAHLPPGAALLPARTPEGGPGPVGRHVILNLAADFHYPVLAVPRRRVFVPTLFAHPGQQPVRLHPTWAAIAQGVNQPVPDAMLAELARPEPPPGGVPVAWRYAQDWPRRFDYLLLIDAEGAALEPAVAAMLEPVADEGFARLWRIRR
jgi:hypothetical protein